MLVNFVPARIVGELEGFLGNPIKPDLSKLDGKGALFGKAFVDAAKNQVSVPGDVKAAYDAEMLLLFKTLQAHGAEFGYRTAYETARFIHFYKLLGNYPDGDTTWFPGAFDCVVIQKLLPKLHGSRVKPGRWLLLARLSEAWHHAQTEPEILAGEDCEKQIARQRSESPTARSRVASVADMGTRIGCEEGSPIGCAHSQADQCHQARGTAEVLISLDKTGLMDKTMF
jgi:hypothetical protein